MSSTVSEKVKEAGTVSDDAKRTVYTQHKHVAPSSLFTHISTYFKTGCPLAFQCATPAARLSSEMTCFCNKVNSNVSSCSEQISASTLSYEYLPYDDEVDREDGSSESHDISPQNSNDENESNGLLHLYLDNKCGERSIVINTMEAILLGMWWLLRSRVVGVKELFPVRSVELKSIASHKVAHDSNVSKRVDHYVRPAIEARTTFSSSSSSGGSTTDSNSVAAYSSNASTDMLSVMSCLPWSSTLRRLVLNGRHDTHTRLHSLASLSLLNRLKELDMKYITVDYEAHKAVHFDEKLMRVLAHLEKLTIGDFHLARHLPLAQLVQLREVDLSGTGVDDAALAAMTACTRLRKVSLAGCGLVHCFDPLAQLSCLTILDLRCTSLNDQSMRRICDGCTDLRKLYVAQCRALRSCACLSTLRYLHTLDLSSTEVDTATVSSLHSSPRLRVLRLCHVTRNVTISANFLLPPTLHEVDCRGFFAQHSTATTTALSPLILCTQMRHCTLASCTGMVNFSALTVMRKLVQLDVSNTCFNDDHLTALTDSCSDTLQCLVVRSCQHIKNFNIIAYFRHLRKLTVCETYIDDAGLNAIVAACTQLSCLSLDLCRRIRSLSCLVTLPSLHELGVSGLAYSDSNKLVLDEITKHGVKVSKRLPLPHYFDSV